jgi:tetratricopeptide (TPR) repeat protein
MRRSGILLWLTLVPVAASADDRVDYFDRTKMATVVRLGKIDAESPAGVTILFGLTTKTKSFIPYTDVVETRYEEEPPETAQARALEAKKQYDMALARYREALARAPKTNRFLLAYLEWKVVRLVGMNAEGETATSFTRGDAVNHLRRFLKEHPDSRFTVDALDLMGRLILRDDGSAAEVITGLRAVKQKHGGAAKELGQRCDLLESHVLLQEGQNLFADKPEEAKARYKEAAAKLTELAKVVDKSAAYDVRVGLAECQAALGQLQAAVKELDAILKDAPDDRVRMLAYLTRGDCYRMNKQYRDAMWDYLWIDVIYNQDREATARALYQLIAVFTELGDNPKADQTKERLKKEYGDTRYGKRG